LRYGDGTFQHGAFAFPDWRQVALDLMPIPVLPGMRRLWAHLLHSRVNGRYPAHQWQDSRPFQVDFVLGAAMFVRSAAIDAVGGLDDDFFMYCEEMDWCLRMAASGYCTYAVPRAVVIHHEAQSSRQVHRAAYLRLWRSRLHFFAKHPDRYTWLHRTIIHAMARLHWQTGKTRTFRALAAGYLTGSEAQAELDTYAELLRF
jgi:GT2 family glycosyltransferase